MPKDVPAQESAPLPETAREPSRLETLRTKITELRTRVPDLKVEVIEASAKDEVKGHVKASWGRTRVSHVVEPPFTLDQSEIAVLEVVIANLTVS